MPVTHNQSGKRHTPKQQPWFHMLGAKSTDILEAYVTVSFYAKNLCKASDFKTRQEFSDFVMDAVDSDGIFGIADLVRVVSITPRVQGISSGY
jgi:hypothetical protein